MATQGPEGRNPILEAEVALVLDNHDGIGISPDDWRERGSYDYLYKKNEFLVSDRDLDRAQRELGGLDVVDSVLDGVSLLRGGDADVRPVLDRVDAALGPGVVTPNHVLSVCPIKLCPATEPAVPATPQPWPSVADVKEGKGVRIAVVDTGFLREGWDKPWLDGVIADDPADIEDPDWWPAKDNYIDPYAGHGTFIAGVIRCLAPGAEVSVEQVLDKAGVVDEAALIKQLDDALAKSPDVISFSAGGYTRRNVPPKAFVEFYESRLRHLKGVVLVAAAGNDSERTPFWPAAFPWAVSVGSLDATGRRRSAFSNFGGWVDVYAPGEELVNAYATGRYQSVFNPADIRDFPDGMCEWSGTSFSTPVVAALIAARMARAGENGRQAADALLTAARIQATPGVGPRLWF